MRTDTYYTGVFDQSSWATLWTEEDQLHFSVGWSSGATGNTRTEFREQKTAPGTHELPAEGIAHILMGNTCFTIQWTSGKQTKVYPGKNSVGIIPTEIVNVQPTIAVYDVKGWRYTDTPPHNWKYL